MMTSEKNRRFYSLWIGLSLLLSLLPFYSIGYLAFIVGATKKIRLLRSFDSYFSNSIIAFFILVSSIMVAGIFTSYLHVPNYAIINTLFAILFTGAILYLQPADTAKKVTKLPVFVWSDTAGIIAGIIMPILIVGLHVTSLGVNGALFRIVNADGWDNTSHLNLLQAVSDNKNYFYTSSPIHRDGLSLSNNYPQGWHLASSSIVDGIVPNVLNPHTLGLQATLIAYLLIVFAWYFIACFTLSKLSWSLLPDTKNKVIRSILFIIAMQFPILALFLTSITSGFVNYLALMPMLLVVVMLSHQVLSDKGRDHLWSYLAVSILLTASVGLTWILPVPALGLLVLLVISAVGIKKRDITYTKWPLVLVAGITLISFLLYSLLFLKDIGVGQLFVGNGLPQHFPNQWTVAASLTLLGLFYGIYRKRSDIRTTALVILPFVILVFSVWLLSYLHSDTLGYYSAKILGLLCVVVFIFTVAAIVQFAESLSDSTKSTSVFIKTSAAFGIVGILLVVSGQILDLRMLQRNQYILSAPERDYVARWIYTDESLQNKGQLLIERDDILAAPSSAMLFNRVSTESAERFLAAASPNKNYDFKGSQTCLLYIYYDNSMNVLPSREDMYASLSSCLKKRDDAGLTTKILLPESAKVEYEKINTYNAELIYHR